MTALRLFRLLHGPGDGGGESAYNCRNPAYTERIERLARRITKLETDVSRLKSANKWLAKFHEDHP